ncbi:hypothetical protein [Longimicrobium terrae]|uniref:Uncharacterized protein n=1 Tax=Longimicrobium terrae TaxID=1639882 RepID=A0A841GQG8_9BACT|nr:hypothetical protein [Longimicrobium terrae]MBB4635329.1 hypothetical protein [Longimicrobium terrae]MBB6069722.1 hypothetical protein [Longimicrobium terrae]NNC31067.1 hypothetical protein [Longimicrobium terrae]
MRLKRRWLAIPLIVPALPLLWEGYFLAGAALSPFSWRERDWNDDGHTSYDEFRYGIDLGKQPAECAPGPPGTEYFMLKDGLPYKVDCARVWSGSPDPRW